MNLLDRPVAPDPYDSLPPVPSFELTSTDIKDGQAMPAALTADGGSVSPQLSWSGFPKETKSFVVTCFDPDAPTPSGYWHWILMDLPADMTSLDAGAGASDLTIDGQAFHIRNDAGEFSYFGAAPPAGDREHRYIFTVHALDCDTLNLSEDTMPATVAFNVLFHTLARARLTVTHQNKG
ncbi:MAG: YbhB/YbcL family Raf kinase inhibitor-like protein [Actinomycetaceae bacterium]|nr:YbhB/YbcL family Raf kinase inhibitor-like protein [Actinomycetaceae bacterium]